METDILWNAIQTDLQAALSSAQFLTWFAPLKPGSVTAGALEILAPTQLHAEWIEQHYMDVLKHAVAKAHPETAEVTFRIAPELRKDAHVRTQAALPLSDGWARPQLHELYTFDNFVVGPSNQLAHAAATAVAESPASAYNPLFLHSSVGLGKSHLLQAICRVVMLRQPEARVLYLSCETFVNDFISAVERGRMSAFRRRYRQADILVIDDVQFLTGKERTQEELFHTFNALYTAQKQLVLSSDRPPSELDGLEERLVSRFKWGLVARLAPPAFETRVAIIHKKARLRGIVLPPDVEEYIATHILGNIRELEGAITKLQGLAFLANKTIDAALAREALSPLESQPASPPAHVVVERVCKQYGVKPTDLRSKKRSRSIVLPRQVAMYLLRQVTPASLEEIGAALGGRDHSTVLYGIDKIEKSREDDLQLDAILHKLQTNLTERPRS